MTAEIIPFPEPPSYLDYCHSPEDRYCANALFKILAKSRPKARAERITRNLMKRLCGEPPPAS